MEVSFDGFIVVEELSTLGQLKLYKATTNGKNIKKGDDILVKPFQVVKFETKSGVKIKQSRK